MGVLNLLWQKRRMGCTGELNRLVLLRFKNLQGGRAACIYILYIQLDKIYKEYKNENLRVESTHTA